MRQSERADRHREVGAPLGDRFEGVTLLREDGSPTYQLATVVDDIDFGITHIVRGNDHRPNEAVHRRLVRGARRDAAGVRPSRPDPRRRRAQALEARRRRDGRVAARGRLPGGSCARVPRGARRAEARRPARPAAACGASRSRRSARCRTRSSRRASAFPSRSRRCCAARATSSRRASTRRSSSSRSRRRSMRRRRSSALRELVEAGTDPKSVVRELKAVGGNLKALRLALTGAERGPELAAVIAALPRGRARSLG